MPKKFVEKGLTSKIVDLFHWLSFLSVLTRNFYFYRISIATVRSNAIRNHRHTSNHIYVDHGQ
jgi:hypothetical protein